MEKNKPVKSVTANDDGETMRIEYWDGTEDAFAPIGNVTVDRRPKVESSPVDPILAQKIVHDEIELLAACLNAKPNKTSTEMGEFAAYRHVVKQLGKARAGVTADDRINLAPSQNAVKKLYLRFDPTAVVLKTHVRTLKVDPVVVFVPAFYESTRRKVFVFRDDFSEMGVMTFSRYEYAKEYADNIIERYKKS